MLTMLAMLDEKAEAGGTSEAFVYAGEPPQRTEQKITIFNHFEEAILEGKKVVLEQIKGEWVVLWAEC